MTPSTVSQPLANAVAQAQSGYDVVANVVADFAGGDALLGFSGSAWTQTVGPISLELWLDGQPMGAGLSIYANATQMHMCLGRTWVYCPAVPPGTHKLTVMAGANTITDQNDRVSLTIWQMGDGLAVRAVTDTPCPAGVGQVLATERFEAQEEIAYLISASCSGWVTQAGAVVGIAQTLDGGDALTAEVLANNANQHLAAVPVDIQYTQVARGLHEMQLVATSNTSTDQGDIAHLAAVEWVSEPDAPAVLAMNPWLQSSPAESQGGGDPFAVTTFSSNGGTVLLRVSASAWTQQAASLLGVSIQVDGKPVGRAELFANPASTHLTVVSNDLVVPALPAGQHKLVLQADEATITDQNDRVSVFAMELPG